jgi:hypothetical protein
LEDYNRVLVREEDARKLYRAQGSYSAMFDLKRIIDDIVKGKFIDQAEGAEGEQL